MGDCVPALSLSLSLSLSLYVCMYVRVCDFQEIDF